MSNTAPARGAPTGRHRAVWALDAGIAVFALTTGVLLASGFRRGAVFGAFSSVGRRIAREIVLPVWVDATVGMVVHLGQCLVLGVLTALLLGNARVVDRMRAALTVGLVWELTSRVSWLAVVRADVAAGMATVPRVGLLMLLCAALAVAPRREVREGARE